MKNLYLTLFLSLVITIEIQSQTLVKNINPGSASSSPIPAGSVSGNMIFWADDGTHGSEPWISDGTLAGTKMILDINPGLPSSHVTSGTMTFNNKFYFLADDGSNGIELWATDGTASGTLMIKNINPGAASAMNNSLMVVFNGKLYFSANDGSTGFELWSTDGTSAGTSIVKNISPAAGSSFPANYTVAFGKLFFTADDGSSGNELWKTDGTTSNTVKVGDIGAGVIGGNPSTATEFQGFIYFNAKATATEGTELWRSDGNSVELVKNINPAANASSSPSNFTVVGNTLYFTADDGSSGNELWKTDGTVTGTVIVKNIAAGAASSSPASITTLNNKLIFFANDGISGTELWSSDGTSSGTTQIMDINTGSGSGFINLTSYSFWFIRGILFTHVVNNIFYFAGNDGTNGIELWKTDGTAAGTIMLNQINPSTGSAAIDWIYISDNKVWMRATDGTSGLELFKYDIPGSNGINNPLPETTSILTSTLTVYPNPSQNKITISEKGFTTIYDMNGKMIEAFENNGETHDISNFIPGMYIINTVNGDKLFSTRFVKN